MWLCTPSGGKKLNSVFCSHSQGYQSSGDLVGSVSVKVKGNAYYYPLNTSDPDIWDSTDVGRIVSCNLKIVYPAKEANALFITTNFQQTPKQTRQTCLGIDPEVIFAFFPQYFRLNRVLVLPHSHQPLMESQTALAITQQINAGYMLGILWNKMELKTISSTTSRILPFLFESR